jgi:hypothetical protein
MKMNCSRLLIDNKGLWFDLFSQTDPLWDKMKICDRNKFMQSFHKNRSKLCNNLCPIDCVIDGFVMIKNNYNEEKLSDPKFSLYWDDNKPFIVYRETPVMTFTDYFCYIGGLLGM